MRALMPMNPAANPTMAFAQRHNMDRIEIAL